MATTLISAAAKHLHFGGTIGPLTSEAIISQHLQDYLGVTRLKQQVQLNNLNYQYKVIKHYLSANWADLESTLTAWQEAGYAC